jgi:SAM-dependent methyltransferase
MNINSYIKTLIGEKDLKGLKPGTNEFFKAQSLIIQRKFLLRAAFENFYSKFKFDLMVSDSQNHALKIVELGSGGGFIKKFLPNIITSDLQKDIADMQIDAQSLPFKDGELKGILMTSVFHHIPNAELFLTEASRTLCKGGICAIVEPCNSLFSRFFYRVFHHEPFNPTSKNWNFDQADPMSDTNQALSWIVFERDIELFKSRFPDLVVEKKEYLPSLGYVLSGGIGYRSIIPKFFNEYIIYLERILNNLNKYFSVSWYILIRKL